jgi:hypothetical protein
MQTRVLKFQASQSFFRVIRVFGGFFFVVSVVVRIRVHQFGGSTELAEV